MNTFQNGLNWYVIRSKPRSEQLAQSFLEQHGLITFLPRLSTPRIKYGKVLNTLNPLFPNYLFVQCNLRYNYPLIKWGKGISKILGLGKYPSPISDDILELIKTRTDNLGIVKNTCNLSKNDPIRITSGPLKDLLGIFEGQVSESGRIKILLNLIGYQPKVELHYSQVEKMCG